jgi:hypothetical protein
LNETSIAVENIRVNKTRVTQKRLFHQTLVPGEMFPMTPKQSQSRKNRNNRHSSLIGIESAYHSGIQPQEVQQEAPYRVNNQIDQENIPMLETIAISSCQPE